MKKILLGLLFLLLTQSVHARYFDPDAGRFSIRDPLEYIDGMNLYAGYFAQEFQMDPMGEKVDRKFYSRGKFTTKGYHEFLLQEVIVDADTSECDNYCGCEGDIKISLTVHTTVTAVKNPLIYQVKNSGIQIPGMPNSWHPSEETQKGYKGLLGTVFTTEVKDAFKMKCKEGKINTFVNIAHKLSGTILSELQNSQKLYLDLQSKDCGDDVNIIQNMRFTDPEWSNNLGKWIKYIESPTDPRRTEPGGPPTLDFDRIPRPGSLR